jgi:hypothetical protein
VERLRRLPWNGRHDEAHAALGTVAAIAGAIGLLNGLGFERKAARLVELCAALCGHIGGDRPADRSRVRGRRAWSTSWSTPA